MTVDWRPDLPPDWGPEGRAEVERIEAVKLVSATRGKAARAEPVALRFETSKARLAGHFPQLEDELAGLTCSGFEGAGPSPDRADAMVWAMSELFEKPRAVPRITLL